MHYRATYLVIILIAFFSCSFDDQPADPGPVLSTAPRTYPAKAVLHERSLESWDNALIEQAAEANLVILPIDRCFSTESRAKLAELHRLNPDVSIIAFHSLLGVLTLWPDTNYLRTTLPYILDYYYAVRDDWAWTTTGDTLMIWKDLIFLNPIKNGSLNRKLIEETVDLVARYQKESGNAIDGILHDYFMPEPYINPRIQDRVQGEIDFDGDGIAFADDKDERSLFLLWQKEYVRAFRDRFGRDFIQIGNGRTPQEDAELAGLLNGILYESFPLAVWRSDVNGFVRFLDNQKDGYLRKARGRTWSIVMDEYGDTSGGNLFCLLTSLLTGCFHTELYGSCIFNGWTLAIEPGAPLGPMVLEGRPDSALTVKRAFENGEARIRFSATGRRDEAVFDPTIVPAR